MSGPCDSSKALFPRGAFHVTPPGENESSLGRSGPPDFAPCLDARPAVLIRCARARSPARHASMSDAKTPADFLKSIKGQKVLVKLNSGVDYRGIMSSLDGYMNIAMEQTEVSSRDP